MIFVWSFRLLKLKEEMHERILFKKRHIDCQNKPELDANLNKMYKNFVTSSTASVEQNKVSWDSKGRYEVAMTMTMGSGVSARCYLFGYEMRYWNRLLSCFN